MAGQKRFSIPWQLIAYDLIGAFLFAVGLYQYVGEGKGIFYMIVGLLLMVPLVFHIVNLSQKSKKRR